MNYALLSNSTENMGVTRIDYQKSEKHTIFGRFYETNLDQGDWVVTGIAEHVGQNISFSRNSNPNVRGNIQVFGFPGETQFQVQIRGD